MTEVLVQICACNSFCITNQVFFGHTLTLLSFLPKWITFAHLIDVLVRDWAQGVYIYMGQCLAKSGLWGYNFITIKIARYT